MLCSKHIFCSKNTLQKQKQDTKHFVLALGNVQLSSLELIILLERENIYILVEISTFSKI